MKKSIALLLLLAMILGMAACAANPTTPADTSAEPEQTTQPAEEAAPEAAEEAEPAPAEEGGTLTLFVQAADDVRISIMDDYIKPNFDAAFPGWTLEITVIGTDANTQAAMKTYNATGDLPDVYWSDPNWSYAMVSSGNQLNIKDYITADGFADHYNGDIGLMTYKGGVYALQPGSDAHYYPAFFYNKQIFADNGIEIPTNLDELFAACDKLLAAGITPLTLDGVGAYLKMAWVQQIITLKDPSKTQALLDGEIDWSDPVVLDALQTIETMLDKGYFGDRMAAAARTTAESREQMISGQVAMMLDFYWDWTLYADIADVFMLKSDNGENVLTMWGNNIAGYAVFAGSEHVDMAVKLAEYCCEQEAIYHNEHGTATAFNTGITPEAGGELQQKLNDIYDEITFKQTTICNCAMDSATASESQTLLSGFTAGQYTAAELADELNILWEANTIFD